MRNFTFHQQKASLSQLGRSLFFFLIISGLILHGIAASAQSLAAVNSSEKEHDDSQIEKMLRHFERQIFFTENVGQWDKNVLYQAEFPLGKAIATRNGMLMRAFDKDDMQLLASQGIRAEEAARDGMEFNEAPVKVKSHAWLMQFVNQLPNARIEAKSAHNEQFNYFMGSVAATNVSSYKEIWYKDIYKNVDVRYYPSESGELEYDIIAKKGFNPKDIVIRLEGVNGLKKGKKGELIISTSVGEMSLPAPYSYQQIGSKRQEVASSYIIEGKDKIRFELAEFNKELPLIIDPIALRWATWINSNSAPLNGSSGHNHGHGIWVDPSDGAIYIVSRVEGQTDNITPGAYETTPHGGVDLIVGKYYEPTTIGGSGQRVWQTYIGGAKDDNPYALEQGPDGNIYITGYTTSTDFPMIGGSAFGNTGGIDHRSQAGQNTFVLKINKAGNSIKSAVLGGDGKEEVYDLRMTPQGDILVCGSTASKNLATMYPGSGAINRSSSYDGGTDVLLFKLNQSLSNIIWMKNYGGTGSKSSLNADVATIMTLNPINGDIFVGGHTKSSNFPVSSNARQSSLNGSQSGFLQKFKSNGTQVWSSYFNSASSKSTAILCMEFNTLRNKLYFGGITSGLDSPANMPASNVYDNTYNGGTNDFFVACIDTSQQFIASTYIGGANNETNMMGLNVDLNNDVYIFGYTNSVDFPVTADALQKNLNNTTSNGSSPNNDKVFFKLPADLKTAPLYSTFFGGANDDYDPVGERGIKFSNCRIYTIVTAKSNDIPLTQGAVTTTKLSSTNIYESGLVVWSNPPDLLNNTISGNQTICAGAIPTGLTGSVPNYSLANIIRNGVSSTYPVNYPSATTYTWQMSSDSTNWTDIPGGNTQNLAAALMGALTQKTYYRRIIGGDACVIAGAADQSVTVKVLSVPAEVTHVSCKGLSDGKIKATPDGTPPYQYSWKKNNVLISTNQTISGLAPGSYEITVTDASNCSASKTYTITEPTVLSATANATSATCGSNNGSATANASGGTAPYTYLWSNNATTANISGVGAGFYSVTVKDANLCETSANVTVSNISNLSAGTASVTPVDCKGNSTGSVTLKGSNGVQPYTYSFNGSAYGSNASFGRLAAGNYPASVKDNAGCISNIFVEITEPAESLTASLGSKSDAVCAGQPGGSASITVSGGTAPYSYTWSPSGGTGASSNSLVPGNYTVTVKDARQCEAALVAFSIGYSDINPPVWTSAAGSLSRTVECGNDQALNQAQALQPVASDNCSLEYIKTSGAFVSGGCGGAGTYTNTWVAKDASNNSSTVFTQIITVTDNEAPVISACASDKTVSAGNNCKASVPDFTQDISASDNCSTAGQLVISQSPKAGTQVSPGNTTVTIKVKDACGNESVCTAILHVSGVIDAVNDAGVSVNGYTGGTSVSNVLNNDKLNCSAVNPSDITISQRSSSHPGISLQGNAVVVAPGTPAGNYSLIYKICEVANPSNCDEAEVTVPVTAATIVANDDNGSAINGLTGGLGFSNVLSNDKLNGAAVNPSEVTITLVSSLAPEITLSGTDVYIAPGTPAGSYTLTYKICEILNPSNCDNAVVTVPVIAPSIDAVDDNGVAVNGFTGGVSFSNVLVNDLLNGVAVDPSKVTLSFVSATHAGISLNGSNVEVAAGTPAGNYTLTYKICDNLNPSNCDQAKVTVPVTAPSIDARDDNGGLVNGFAGGTSLVNVLANDLLNGVAVDPAKVNLTFVSSSNPGVSLSGRDVVVAPGTNSGNYTLTYKICEILNPSNCDQATVTVPVSAEPPVATKGEIEGCYTTQAAAEAAAIAATGVTAGNCAGNVTKTAATTGSCEAQITVTVSDQCGNHGDVVYNTRIDNQAPVWTNQVGSIDRSVNCSDASALASAQALKPSASDQCSGEISYQRTAGTFVADGCGMTGTYTNTWTATDACGNISEVFTQIISIVDQTAPDWTSLAGSLNRSVSCDDADGLAAAQELRPVATDFCGSDITISKTSGSYVSNECGGSYTNTFTATDACGNTSTVFTQTIAIFDQKAPVWITAPAALHVSLSCEDADGLAQAQSLSPEAHDACSGVSYIKTSGEFVAGSCANTGTYTNEWIAKDACGNTSAKFIQIISIRDQSAPQISVCAKDSTVEAGAGCKATVPDFSSLVIASDNCSTAAQLVISQTPAAGSIASTGNTLVTIRVEDACGNSSNCQVNLFVKSVIDAVDDAGNSLNGFAGGVSLDDVLANDKLNCATVNPSDVNLSQVSSSHPGVSLDGQAVVVAPGTPAGEYNLVYKICEKTNPSVCDEAIVTVNVTAATIIANDDVGNNVNGYTGGISFTNILGNDKLNGLPINESEINLSFISATYSGITLVGSDVHVAAGTPVGNYTLTYRICEILNPANCDDAVVSVPVKATAIDAVDDAGISVNGFTGGTSFSNVLANDKLNGSVLNPADVTLSFVSSTHAGISLSGSDVVVAPGTPSGNYSLTYSICEKLNPTNCDQAQVSVMVSTPLIDAIDDEGVLVNGFTGGVSFTNILANDLLNGTPVTEADVAISFVSSTHPGITLNGKNVVVAPGTSTGNYSLTYKICELVNPSNCDQANVSVPVSAEAPQVVKGEIAPCYATSSEAEAAAIAATTIRPGTCGSDITKTAAVNGTCNALISVRYVDNCGNKGTVNYSTRIDNHAPVWNSANGSLDRRVACNDPQALAAAQSLSPEALDDCNNQLSYEKTSGSFVAGNCGSTGTYTNTWIARDACGNTSAVFTQLISIVDETAPVWVSTASSLDRTVDSDDALALAAAQALKPVAQDACGGEVTLSRTEGSFVAASCGGTYTNTWIAKDACGNSSTVFTQVITVNDKHAPEWVTPAKSLNRMIECGEADALQAALSLVPEATDNNGSVQVELVSETVEYNTEATCYHKKWIAKDACGNQSGLFHQIVKVFDTSSPIISEAGPDKTITCPEELVFTAPTATDNCDPNPRVEVLSTVRSAVNLNTGIYYVTRKWIAIDARGNSSAERSQTITVKPIESSITETICQGSAFQLNGNTYTQPGVYKVVIVRTGDCNELVTLNLNVNQPSLAPQSINASSNTVAVGASVALTVNGGSLGTGADWKWYKGACGNGSSIGSGNSIVVSPTETTTYYVRAEGACGNTVCVSKTIEVERPTSACTAYEIISFNQGKRKDYGSVPTARSNQNNALGTPENNDNANAPINYVSLGFGGEIVLKFEYPIANGPGNDLRVYETSYGTPACNVYRERVKVEASQDGVAWKLVGEGCQDAEFDLDVAGLQWALFVKLTDISSRADFGNDADGYDLDGIECLNGNAEINRCVATRVVEVKQGKTKAGQPVQSIRSNPDYALGEPQPVIDGVVNFFSLGFGGEITVEFDQPIANGEGEDVKVFESTWHGKTCSNYPESAYVFASQDGLFFTYLGKTCHSGSFDLGSLSWAKFIRIVDATDPASFPGSADGFDISGITCLNGNAENTPNDGLTGCSLQKVLSYNPGTRKDGKAIESKRSNPEKALGMPENDDTYNFVSLGFGGTLVLGFDYVIFNHPGNDIKVIETSFGSPKCTKYPEQAEISASFDMVSWVVLDTLCQDGELDLKTLPFVQFLMFRDLSDPSRFRNSDEGYDVDGVIALFDGCAAITPRIGERQTENQPEEKLHVEREEILVDIFPNPTTGDARISFNGLKQSASYQLTVFDPAGRLLQKGKIEVNGGQNYYDLNTSGYPAGVLLILINGEQERYVQRLVKK